ncbi:energy transducer TonB [Luteimonas sp. BDR2-5]|uniref:energy transducer TonB n=1 Tax=Proluteimonas luteida TaxID=2878685 RepID=UPI001E3AEBC5|nr:energy transducer TonB [Luteimonas sp. BDR2-5]MCD9027242.1 energy transducer TonB [Luteimonas sp. BDR2-5]
MNTNRVLGLLLVLACLLPPLAHAQTAREMRSQVEASMLVTGTVDIDREGRATAHALDQPDKLPPYVISLVERAVPQMRFEPVLVDGAPVLARAKMSLRLVATPAGDGDMTLAIQSAHFGEEDAEAEGSGVRSSNMRPPRYPTNVVQIGGKGTVYLLVKVARDGSVDDVVAEQVNLTALGSARQMESIRNALAKASVDTARRHWSFIPPSEGENAPKDYWVVRVPVEFTLGDDSAPGYGEWAGYLPGPKTRPAWAEPDPPGFSPDALAAGDVQSGQSRFRLLTPLGG